MPERIWFVIAAAGASSRFGGSTPKPYLRIAGKSLLEHALHALGSLPGIAGGVVVTAAGDRRFRRLPKLARRGVVAVTGGPTRAVSVLNGLQALVTAAPEDWVLVHDAARPCVPRADLAALLAECRRDAVGGLLAIPVTDTLKQSDDEGDRSARTVPRERLWRALTPQMFRFEVLDRALRAAAAPTDEAQAVEALGLLPKLVRGDPDNIKITLPEDIERATRLLKSWSAA